MVLSNKWCERLKEQPETSEGFQIVDVFMKDGIIYHDIYAMNYLEIPELELDEENIDDIVVVKDGE